MRKPLAGTGLANAQVGTLQRHLLKLGVLVKKTCRRVRLSFALSGLGLEGSAVAVHHGRGDLKRVAGKGALRDWEATSQASMCLASRFGGILRR